MPQLTVSPFQRPPDMNNNTDPDLPYVRSYLLTRTVVGIIGILLPIVLIIGEAFFLKGGVQVRGSLSAYYHSSMQDIFVGSLSAIGLLLVTYMSGTTRTLEFWFSLIAGFAVLVVAFFPTWRPGIPAGAPLCGSHPEPLGCSPIEQILGEGPTATIHATAAAVFILSLALISFFFGHDERKYNNSRLWQRFHICCGTAILVACAWVVIGGILKVDIWELTPLYLGEVISVWAFALSWLVKGKKLWHIMGRHASR